MLKRENIINNFRGRGRGSCGKDTRCVPSLNSNNDPLNESRFFSGIPSCITNSTSDLRARLLAVKPSHRPAVPRVSTAKGQKRYWFGRLKSKS
jgi:hypothetical protein